MGEIKIEDGIPIPYVANKPNQSGINEILRKLKVGQSIFLAGKTRTSVSGHIINATAHSGNRYTGRSVDGGCRIWRVA